MPLTYHARRKRCIQAAVLASSPSLEGLFARSAEALSRLIWESE